MLRKNFKITLVLIFLQIMLIQNTCKLDEYEDNFNCSKCSFKIKGCARCYYFNFQVYCSQCDAYSILQVDKNTCISNSQINQVNTVNSNTTFAGYSYVNRCAYGQFFDQYNNICQSCKFYHVYCNACNEKGCTYCNNPFSYRYRTDRCFTVYSPIASIISTIISIFVFGVFVFVLIRYKRNIQQQQVVVQEQVIVQQQPIDNIADPYKNLGNNNNQPIQNTPNNFQPVQNNYNNNKVFDKDSSFELPGGGIYGNNQQGINQGYVNNNDNNFNNFNNNNNNNYNISNNTNNLNNNNINYNNNNQGGIMLNVDPQFQNQDKPNFESNQNKNQQNININIENELPKSNFDANFESNKLKNNDVNKVNDSFGSNFN